MTRWLLVLSTVSLVCSTAQARDLSVDRLTDELAARREQAKATGAGRGALAHAERSLDRARSLDKAGYKPAAKRAALIAQAALRLASHQIGLAEARRALQDTERKARTVEAAAHAAKQALALAKRNAQANSGGDAQ